MFHEIFYKPILNLLLWLYSVVPDIGIVIVILTILIKLVLWPFAQHQLRNQAAMKNMQPELEELKLKYKDDQATLAKETMELYKRHKTSPAGSCLAVIIQLPFLIALFKVFQSGLKEISSEDVYSFINFSGQLSAKGFSLFDMTTTAWPLALLAGLVQFWQSWQMQHLMPAGKSDEIASIMNKQMMYVFPFITFIIGLQFPSGLAVYWIISSLMTILQQHLFLSQTKVPNEDIIEIKETQEKK